jgi:NADPH-dependent curcumin reductase CurA
MPAFTAWIGLGEIGQIAAGETIFISGAAGAVGSAAVQIALQRGCRVIGSAGSEEKVAWLQSLGAEAFDYRTADLREVLQDGIDVYFDNVGGVQLEAALKALRTHGRVIACGAISRYNDAEVQPGPRNFFFVVTKRLRIQGFIIFDHNQRFPEFLAEAGQWLRDGKLQYRETIVDGFENVPSAFLGLFHGENVGKMLVRVSPDE